MNRPSRPFAFAAALALLAQSTGAAGIPSALLRMPAAFPPPAARFSAFPAARPASASRAAAAAPKAASRGALAAWLESARLVAAYLLEQADAPPASAPLPARARAERQDAFIAAPPPVETEGPPADRMLVVMEKGVSVQAVLGRGEPDFSEPPASAVSRPFPTLPAFNEAWIAQGGLRARLAYQNPHGVVTGGAEGYHAVFADGSERFAPVKKLEPAYRRSFAIYFHEETVNVEITVVNDTGKTLRNVRLDAVQETFRPVGTEGTRLNAPQSVSVADELAPGKTATARWSVVLHGPGLAAVNLAQTHVTIRSGEDPSAAPLLDAPQAGVVDPPGRALMP